MIHLALHFLVPGLVAHVCYAPMWRRAWIVMLAAMLIDVDHLIADPVFDPNRCSIGFHPLHSYAAIAVYLVLLLAPVTRLIGLGLIIHVLLDGLDCLWMRIEA